MVLTMFAKTSDNTLNRSLIVCAFLALSLSAYAAEPAYPREIAQWQEVRIPADSDHAAGAAWLYSANNSRDEWRVFSDDGRICTELTSAKPLKPRERPKFIPKAGRFFDAPSVVRVDDGWLVGFNQGEFGAALYWFSLDGKHNYKISDDQIVDFIALPDGLYAIEGLAHLSMSEGSLIRISRSQSSNHWQAANVTTLPFAPYAVSARRDGTMLITLSDSIVQISNDRATTTLLPDAPWRGLYPNSSVLSSDEQKLYIGMRQFVGEFDISTKKLRLLVPSAEFLNKISQKDEQKVHK